MFTDHHIDFDEAEIWSNDLEAEQHRLKSNAIFTEFKVKNQLSEILLAAKFLGA
jgi:hypothetical protein